MLKIDRKKQSRNFHENKYSYFVILVVFAQLMTIACRHRVTYCYLRRQDLLGHRDLRDWYGLAFGLRGPGRHPQQPTTTSSARVIRVSKSDHPLNLPNLDLLFVLRVIGRSSGPAFSHWKAWKHRLGSRVNGPDSYPLASSNPYSCFTPTVAPLRTAFSFSDIAYAAAPDISRALLCGQQRNRRPDFGYLLTWPRCCCWAVAWTC